MYMKQLKFSSIIYSSMKLSINKTVYIHTHTILCFTDNNVKQFETYIKYIIINTIESIVCVCGKWTRILYWLFFYYYYNVFGCVWKFYKETKL